MTLFRALLACVLAVFLTAAQAQAQSPGFVPVPPLQARVTDQIGMLTDTQRNALENVLKEYEDKTGSQIAILLMSKTEPESIEQYSIRVFDAWKLGRKGIDDGVLLIVARDNPTSLSRLRLEVGRGAEGVLTDAQSKRILQDVIAPHFRQDDFYGGLVAAVTRITGLLDQEQFPAPSGQPAQQQGDDFEWLPLLLFIACAVFFFYLSRTRGGYTRYGNDWGRSAGGVIIGSQIGRDLEREFERNSGGGFGGGGFGGGGFGGGGGSGAGGGASGGW
jgi:uncharacterized protein